MDSLPAHQEPTGLPLHPMPDLPDAEDWLLTLVDGEASCTLDCATVAALPHVGLVDTLTCLEGWSAGPLHWRGVRVETLLAQLGSASEPTYLAVFAPDVCATIALTALPEESLVADSLNGEPLPRVNGGPYRLVVPGAVCYQSVKWVQRIERRGSSEGDTAKEHAAERLRAQHPSHIR